LVGWESQDATVACLPIDQLKLHFRVEFKTVNMQAVG